MYIYYGKKSNNYGNRVESTWDDIPIRKSTWVLI